MSILYGNAVVGQSGGPTAAINATLAGVINGALEARRQGVIDKLYGMKNGIEGFLEERFVDLFSIFENEESLDLLKTTPAAALGSCRRKLKGHDVDGATYSKILDILKKYNIRYFFYIGGNDSMDTVLKLSEYAKNNDYELKVVGVPKTIDNDLKATDHTPGFGSAAKYIATTVKEIIRDISVYTVKAVTIVEIMGRDAGWLTASSALTSLGGEVGPDLIYLPEREFSQYEFISDIEEALGKKDAVLVAISEGIKDASGEYVGANSSVIDAFGHKALSGAGRVLEALVKEKIGCKVRSIELNLPQRCAAHLSSLTDLDESVTVGAEAVGAAVSGATGVMMTIDRQNGNEYSIKIGMADISTIANGVKSVPERYINERGNGITEECLEYLRPLILGEPNISFKNGMPMHFIID